jgi:geranylgeranyl pyrophosphate synthase
MTDSRFDTELEALRARCDNALVRLLGHGSSEFSPAAGPYLTRWFEAAAYSLTRGGKRVRPALVYAAAQAVEDGIVETAGANAAIDYLAVAVEMIHAYSLVHDDLPAMDDDDMRRGQATCHVAFDEPTAILVGDGLQARAFELLAEAPGLTAEVKLALLQVLTAAAGARGMVGGQAIDVAAVDIAIDDAHLETMHALKTGALIRASVAMGAIVAGADSDQQNALDDFADAIGLAFQVCDDILDASGNSDILGKQAGGDAAKHKPTYVSLLGLDEARAKADGLLDDALEAISGFDDSAWMLRDLARYVVHRTH